jgi:hypothetical protein
MNHYVTIGSSSSGISTGVHCLDTALFMTLIAGTPILGPIVVRRMRKIRGPVLTGTAQVLSLKQFGSVAVNGPARMICRFRLRVQVPGREPYDVAHWQNFAPWELNAVAPGGTVSVEVDETKPKGSGSDEVGRSTGIPDNRHRRTPSSICRRRSSSTRRRRQRTRKISPTCSSRPHVGARSYPRPICSPQVSACRVRSSRSPRWEPHRAASAGLSQ